jgi:excisionase family DNA binding protein
MPGQAAAILRVDANTLARWADSGRLGAVRTPGGHRRYLASEVHALAVRGFWTGDDAEASPA